MQDLFNRFSLQDQVAVITGAGRGIGEGIAKDMAAAGAKVALAGATHPRNRGGRRSTFDQQAARPSR